jgi:methyl-accepting chemotaxis protein
MSSPSSPQDNTQGSGLILALIVFLCLVMIGVTGYMKHELNQSETALLTPERALEQGQSVYEKIQASLGYGGFMAAAKDFANSKSPQALADMQQAVATANSAFETRAAQLPAAKRRDLQAILAAFDETVTKAKTSLTEGAPAFTTTDVMPLTLALATLDARLQGLLNAERFEAQSMASTWSLGLLLVAWISLVLAAGMAIMTWLMLSNRQSVPLRALAQSAQNLAKGDLQTPIWGMERKDLLGDLARSIDMARYHFGKLPDLSLMSEQGPVQLKFEGETRSLFDAMMRNMADDYERARREISELSQTTVQQQALIGQVAQQLETVIGQLEQQGTRNDQVMVNITRNISDSAANLISTQEKAAIQINRIAPFLQDKAQKLAEVTAMAGTQIASTLQSLLQSSLDLKQSVSQSQQSVQQLAGETGAIGERIFAALNILQASGKVLQDTTDSTQSRMNEALRLLDKGGTGLLQIINQTESRIATSARTEADMSTLVERTQGSAKQLETVVTSIMEREAALRTQLEITAERLGQMSGSFGTAQATMAEATHKISSDSTAVAALVTDLRQQQDQLMATLKQNSQTSYSAVQQLTERSGTLLQRLEQQIMHQAATVEQQIETLAAGSAKLSSEGDTATSQLSQLATTLHTEQARYEAARRAFADRLDSLGNSIEQQAAATFGKTTQLSEQSYAKLAVLGDSADGILQRLGMLGQLTTTLGSVAGQLGQLLPALGNGGGTVAEGSGNLAAVTQELTQQWQSGLHEIEAMHDGLAQIIVQQKDQLETRLAVIDSKLKTALASGDNNDQQNAIMNEIVLALSKINDHVLQLDETVQELKRG